jgi:VanZ family protein
MIAIFLQSSIGKIDLPYLGFKWHDKVLHFIVFGILSFLIARSFKKTKISSFNKYYMIWAVVLTGLYGFIDEYHQYFVPGRSSTVGDWVADMLGAIAFVLMFYYRERWNQLKTEKAAS